MFNKAAKNITVDESETGEVKVDMNIDKSDLSTKKMRKKMMKKVRNQLYSNFVKSGTLTGGKMEEVEKEEQMEVVKDLSKIKELSDDQLVAACGGLTAHKGGRHGLNMKAKLDRIAEAEREFLEKYGGAAVTKNGSENSSKKKKRKHQEIEDVVASVECGVIKKKKKKKDKCRNEDNVTIDEPPKKKKKKKSQHQHES